ncbi:MAG: hypothetical protein WCL60_11315 [Methylococcales bacterium]
MPQLSKISNEENTPIQIDKLEQEILTPIFSISNYSMFKFLILDFRKAHLIKPYSHDRDKVTHWSIKENPLIYLGSAKSS